MTLDEIRSAIDAQPFIAKEREIARLRAALDEIRDEVEPDIDITDAGGPNQAGRIVNIIDRALGRMP